MYGVTRQRLYDWPARLTGFIQESKARSLRGELHFNWDPTQPNCVNCLTFAGSAMEALFGANPYEKLGLGISYSNQEEAEEALINLGWRTLPSLLDTVFNRQKISETKRGDLIIVAGQMAHMPDMGPTELHLIDLDTPLRLPPKNVRTGMVVALADPPFFWVVSSSLGLSKGPLDQALTSFSTQTMFIPGETL